MPKGKNASGADDTNEVEESRVDTTDNNKGFGDGPKPIGGDNSPATLSARAVRDEQEQAEKPSREAELEAKKENDKRKSEQMKADVDAQHEQSATAFAALNAAEKKAKSEDITTEEALAENAKTDDDGALDVLNRVENGATETPKADAATFTPVREQSAVELMTHAEGASMESRQLGTSNPTATNVNAAENLTNIADYYDILRGVSLGTVFANDNSMSAVGTWFGQYQVRLDGDFSTPSREPDVKTLHGSWWEEGDNEATAYFVGKSLDLEGVVYRIPRMVASIPSPSHVRYVDDATSQKASESRQVSEEYAGPKAEQTDMGIGRHERPEAVLSPHLNPLDTFSNQNATLGGFSGQAIPVGPYVAPASQAQESYQEMLNRRFSPGFDPEGTVDAGAQDSRSPDELARETEASNGYDSLINVGNHMMHFDPEGTVESQQDQAEERPTGEPVNEDNKNKDKK